MAPGVALICCLFFLVFAAVLCKTCIKHVRGAESALEALFYLDNTDGTRDSSEVWRDEMETTSRIFAAVPQKGIIRGPWV
eukprot:522871-Amorphochlora_amoeboformis.AAC.1